LTTLFATEGPIAPSTSPSGVGEPRSAIRGSPDRVSDTPPRVGEVASEYAPPPDMVVDAFLPVEPARVVDPQPRYPDEPSSLISYRPAPAPAPASAGIVGSALGLYPYSSTSLRLCSSASFRCFLLRHKKIPARTRSATAAIGTTTATAILPELLRPALEPSVGLIAAPPDVLEAGGAVAESFGFADGVAVTV
jgi:hypothetical protein